MTARRRRRQSVGEAVARRAQHQPDGTPFRRDANPTGNREQRREAARQPRRPLAPWLVDRLERP